MAPARLRLRIWRSRISEALCWASPSRFLFADDRNDTGLGVSIARRWYAEGVDAITDVANSAVALAVQQLSRESKKIVLFSGPASADLTGQNCSPYAVDWTYDTYALAHGTAHAIVRSGGNSWFFIAADYAFGYAMQRDASNVIRSDGGTVLGSVFVPLGCPTSPSIFCKRKRQLQRSWVLPSQDKR